VITIKMLFSDVDTPVVIVDSTGIIVHVNLKFEQQLSWKSSELVGKPLSLIIPKNMRDAHNLGFSRYITTNTASILNTPLDLDIITGNEEVVSTEHIIIAEEINGVKQFGARIKLK